MKVTLRELKTFFVKARTKATLNEKVVCDVASFDGTLFQKSKLIINRFISRVLHFYFENRGNDDLKNIFFGIVMFIYCPSDIDIQSPIQPKKVKYNIHKQITVQRFNLTLIIKFIKIFQKTYYCCTTY